MLHDHWRDLVIENSTYLLAAEQLVDLQIVEDRNKRVLRLYESFLNFFSDLHWLNFATLLEILDL